MDASPIDLQTLSVGLLIGRLFVGLLMAAHGAQKLFGWFGGQGLAGTGSFFEQLGFRPGRVFALAAALGEAGGGLLVALGFLGPIGPAVMIAVMIVAMITVNWSHGVFARDDGIEVPLLYAIAAVVFATVGYGSYSLDGTLGLASRWPAHLAWIAIGVGIAGGLTNVALRRGTAAPARG